MATNLELWNALDTPIYRVVSTPKGMWPQGYQGQPTTRDGLFRAIDPLDTQKSSDNWLYCESGTTTVTAVDHDEVILWLLLGWVGENIGPVYYLVES